ncbi:MAG: carboxymuconolactone decarboxylase family protein [Myxococcaceae bacterium]
MKRDEEREARSKEEPIVSGLPDFPGIIAAMRLTPGLGVHLRGLADELLVKPFEGCTLSRAERELIACASSAANDCFYCMDSHGAFASELLHRQKVPGGELMVENVKHGVHEGLSDKMEALLHIAQLVQKGGRAVSHHDIERAREFGATEADTQVVVLIASALAMYNRIVDGLRAKTPASAEAYRGRALEIAEHGYVDPRLQAIPR